MKFVSKHILIPTILIASFMPTLWSSTAAAEGDPLDTANASLIDALQALKAAPVRGDSAKFENHRKKAITLLTRAQGEILKAKRVETK